MDNVLQRKRRQQMQLKKNTNAADPLGYIREQGELGS